MIPILLASLFAVPQTPAAPTPLSPQVIERFLAPDETPLVSYQAVRQMRASTRGGKMRAEMDVQTAFDPVRGFTFTVLSESGSGIIRRHVLMAALQAEQKAVARAAREETAITPANYQFVAATEAEATLIAIGVRAKRKSTMLVNGTLYLDPVRYDLERVEGELADRPSFWTRRIQITRRYDHIAGVHVPVAMESNADVRIVGASTFAMSYRYTEINGRPVAEP
jgi:hypothetical protein